MNPNLARNVVGLVVLALAVCVVAGLFFFPIPDGNHDIAMVILGVVMGWTGAVVQFHFGTSEGSKTKTEMMAKKDGN